MLIGPTALYAAARQGNLEIIAKLVNYFENIDLNIQVAQHGGTPLHGTFFKKKEKKNTAIIMINYECFFLLIRMSENKNQEVHFLFSSL